MVRSGKWKRSNQWWSIKIIENKYWSCVMRVVFVSINHGLNHPAPEVGIRRASADEQEAT